MKKRGIKKLTTVLLSLLLYISLFPNFVSASEGLNQTSTSSETSQESASEEPSEISTSLEYKVTLGSTEYDTLEEAVKAANSGDTIMLGEGHYSLYGINSTGSTKGKDLTFVGKGTDKTTWVIGAEDPDPSKFGTEYNGDYSFDGAGTIVFKNMTLQSGDKDYLGFIRADHTVVEDSIINGKTFYWGYESATFKNTVFNAPKGDYAIWTYSSPVMNFDFCTFNSSGKTINVYSEDNVKKTINFSNCTVNSELENRPVLNINDSNKEYDINISGKNVINGDVARDTSLPNNPHHTATCSRWFGFGGKQDIYNTGQTVVTIDGKTVFEHGHMVSHEIDTDNDQYTDGYKDNAYDVTDWEENLQTNQYTRKKVCKYCGTEVLERGYRVSYDPAGGKWDDASSDVLQKDIVDIQTDQVIENNPTKAGYRFVSWQLDSDPNTSYQPGDNYSETNENNEFVNGSLTAIWEPIHHLVTFMNDDQEYAKINVENSKTIDHDALTDQSMPQDPAKDGFTFIEWNTQKDGQGDKFTGETIVNQDMTVYAIYNMNNVTLNVAPTLEVQDKTITKGTDLELKDLVVSATDEEDGDLKDKVEMIDNGGFDKDKVGEYTILFKVTDKDGASITKKSVVKVIEKDNSNPGSDNPSTKPGSSETVPNTSTPAPKTGDSINMIFYVALLGLSGALLTVMRLKRRKEN